MFEKEERSGQGAKREALGSPTNEKYLCLIGSKSTKTIVAQGKEEN